MTTKSVVEKAVERVKDKVQPQPVARQYPPNLYPIAEARRHTDLMEKREQLRRAEASANALPINAGGWQDPGRVHMQAQVAQLVAQQWAQIAFIEGLSDDDLVGMYASDILAQNEVPPVRELRNSDGSPLARGAYAQPLAPGMPR
jgi:hypothetical protein